MYVVVLYANYKSNERTGSIMKFVRIKLTFFIIQLKHHKNNVLNIDFL